MSYASSTPELRDWLAKKLQRARTEEGKLRGRSYRAAKDERPQAYLMARIGAAEQQGRIAALQALEEFLDQGETDAG
jgi:hypothetical protein